MLFRLLIQLADVCEGDTVTSLDGNTTYTLLGRAFIQKGQGASAEMAIQGEQMYALHNITDDTHVLLPQSTEVVLSLYKHQVMPTIHRIDPSPLL